MQVILPALAPSLISGVSLAFARAVGMWAQDEAAHEADIELAVRTILGQVALDKTPLTADPRVLLRHISFHELTRTTRGWIVE